MIQVKLPEVQVQPPAYPQPEVIRWGPQLNAPIPHSGSGATTPSVQEPLARWAANPAPVTFGPNQAAHANPFVGTAKIAPGPATPPLTARTPGIVVPVQQAANASSAPACWHCGSIFMPDGNFCRRCGKRRNAESQGNATPPQPGWRPVLDVQAMQHQSAAIGPSFGPAGMGFGARMVSGPPAAPYSGPVEPIAMNMDAHMVNMSMDETGN